MRRSKEPFLWGAFSAGGMLAALFLPALVFLLWIAPAFGWVEPLSYERTYAIVAHPLTRLFLFALLSLSFFHWAHRFRFTLYDGLQLYHLNELIAVLTYGLATGLSILAGVILVTF